MDQDIAQSVAQLLMKIHAVEFRFNPPFTFTTGIKSPMYLDNRLVLSYPEIRELIVDYYAQTIESVIGNENVEWISGTASAAIPYASLIASKLRLPLVYVRPTTKEYGKGNQVEGFVEKNRKVLIVEDHISTGASIVENARAIREKGGVVTHCIATTTYELPAARSNFRRNTISPVVLTTGKIIASEAFKQNKLSKKQQDMVEDWLKDAKGWAKRHGYEA